MFIASGGSPILGASLRVCAAAGATSKAVSARTEVHTRTRFKPTIIRFLPQNSFLSSPRKRGPITRFVSAVRQSLPHFLDTAYGSPLSRDDERSLHSSN